MGAIARATPKAKCPFTPQREMMLKLWGKTCKQGKIQKPKSDTAI
jgi:mRNA-degrading endonuclease HigB of HigAB toxin-antitoxin module